MANTESVDEVKNKNKKWSINQNWKKIINHNDHTSKQYLIKFEQEDVIQKPDEESSSENLDNTESTKIGDEEKNIELINPDSITSMYLVTVCSACHTEVYTYPLDIIKTRLHIQGGTKDPVGTGRDLNIRETVKHIVRRRGLPGFYRGFSAIMVKHIFYTGTKISIYRTLKDMWMSYNSSQEKLPLSKLVMCSMIAGAIAQIVASPTDLIKVQLQMEDKRKQLCLPTRVKNFRDAAKKGWIHGRFRGLWLGTLPNVHRSAIFSIRDLSAYEMSKRAVEKKASISDKLILHILSSISAGLFVAVLANPFDIVTNRIMNQPVNKKGKGQLYKGSWDCLQKSVKNEGFFVLYKGFIPAWLRITSWTLIFWIGYDYLHEGIGGERVIL